MSTCRLGVANGEKVIKAKALERLKGDSEAAEQRKKVTVRLPAILIIPTILPRCCPLDNRQIVDL